MSKADSIEKHLQAYIQKTRILGNNNAEYTFKEFCSDLINKFGTSKDRLEKLADGTGLSESTLRRMATLKETETGEDYRPQDDTLVRVMRFFQTEISFTFVKTIKSQYKNKPKPKRS